MSAKPDIDDLAPIDYPGHVRRARQALADNDIDHLIVTTTENIRWLTGFTGSYGLVVLSADRMMLVTDGRYTEQAPAQLSAAGVDLSLIHI